MGRDFNPGVALLIHHLVDCCVEIMGRNYNLRSIPLTRMDDPRNVLHPEVDHEIRVA